jgi:ATP-dependent Lon protease
MTGEITLRGSVLPIGGLNEKAVEARRAKIRTILIPRANEKDLIEMPVEVRESLEFVSVDSMDQVLEHALERSLPRAPQTTPEPAADADPDAHYAH